MSSISTGGNSIFTKTFQDSLMPFLYKNVGNDRFVLFTKTSNVLTSMVHFFSFIQSEKAALISECFVSFFYQFHSSPQIKVYSQKDRTVLGTREPTR